MKYISVVLFCLIAGCSGPTFTNLGNGVAVPVETIEKYATEHGVTRTEARAQLRKETDDRRVKEHAARFGISEAGARIQIEHSDSQADGN